jgi:type I restriction enzyme, S subunit
MSAELKPGYKLTEAGVIPEDWEVTPLSSVTPIAGKNGIVDGPFGSNLKTIHYKKSGIPIITSGYVTDGKFFADKYLYVDQKKFNDEKRSAVRPGDIVMAKIGERCGASAILPESHDIGILSGNALKITVDSSRHSTFYIWQVLWDLYTSGDIDQLKTVGAQPAISMANLKKRNIPLPPTKTEQEAIAEALSDADALIESLEQLITKKRHLKQGAMQELLTGKKRLLGFSGEWEVKRLGDVADPNQKWSFTGGPFGSNLKSSDYIDDGVRIIQLQNIGDGEFYNDSVVFTSFAKANELLSCNIYPGEIILSKMGDPVARACIIPPHHERYLMCSDGIRLAVNPKSFNTYFVYISINAPDFRTRAENAGTGSTRKRIGLTELRNLEILCPELIEQTAIANIISDMDTEIAALETKLAKTRSLKQGMMHELLTGKTRLL